MDLGHLKGLRDMAFTPGSFGCFNEYRELVKKWMGEAEEKIAFKIFDLGLLEYNGYPTKKLFENPLKRGVEIHGLTSIEAKEKEIGKTLEELNETYEDFNVKFFEPEPLPLYPAILRTRDDLIVVDGKHCLATDDHEPNEFPQTGIYQKRNHLMSEGMEKEIMEAYSRV